MLDFGSERIRLVHMGYLYICTLPELYDLWKGRGQGGANAGLKKVVIQDRRH